MKHLITFLIFFLSVACKGRSQWQCGSGDRNSFNSTSYDKRCLKLREEAIKKGEEAGFCYRVPEGEVIFQEDRERLDPNHEACNALYAEAEAKCEALPPDPDSIVHTSGSAIYRGGKAVMVDGKPLCP